VKTAIICDAFGDTPDSLLDMVRAQGVDIEYLPCKTDQDIIDKASDADVLWLIGGGITFTPAGLEPLDQCKAIIRSGSGTDNVPVKAASARNIAVFNTPQATAGPVADGTCALILAAYRRIALQDRLMRKGDWGQWKHWPNAPLEGQTLGLVGFGHIAQQVVKRMRGFDMKMIASDPVIDADFMAKHGVEKVEFETVLRESDIISLHCPLNDHTRYMINRNTMAMMKPSAILVNAARGAVVHEGDLYEALKQNTIAVAALDAYETEPMPAGHPLTELDNVVLNPHSTAHHDRIAQDFRGLGAEIVVTLSRGEFPDSCVNRSAIDVERVV